jgi:hypothetical protein
MVLAWKRLAAFFVNENRKRDFQHGQQVGQTQAQNSQAVGESQPEAAAQEGTHGRGTRFDRENRLIILWADRAAVESAFNFP